MTKIELKHVSKTIHKNEVLHDISFMMESGKIYGFQGVNGSGKTMLMRIIIGLIHPTNGSVEINGKVLGRELEFPESIGFLLENPAFLDRYSGYSNLKLLAEIQNNISDAEIKEVLSLVGLIPLLVHHMTAVGAEQQAGEQAHIIVAVGAFALLA